MPSVIKYSLFLLADLAIIGCIIHFGYSTLTVQGSVAADKLAARSQSSFPEKYDKQKLYSYYTTVLISLGLALYGALVFLFSWMPDRWISYSEDGDPMWMAAALAGTAAIMGAFALPHVLLKTQAELLKLHRLQLREANAKAFVGELSHMLQWFQVPGLEADVFVKLEHAIDEAEKSYNREHEQIYRALLNVLRKAPVKPLPAKSL